MVRKKLFLRIDSGSSSRRNPIARVAYGFCLFFSFSLLAFHMLIPAVSSGGSTSFLLWFYPFSNVSKPPGTTTTTTTTQVEEPAGNISSGVKKGNATFLELRDGVGSLLARREVVGSKISSGSHGKRSFEESCDIFDGKWVRDNREPFYPPGSCPFVDLGFDCHRNGRPDHGFLNWRWQPNHCDIPRMDATDFLERLRGQRLVFVGDSLNRNMWESLVCTLRHSIPDKKRVFEISRRTQFKSKGRFSIVFKDYNCSVDFVRAPFLVKELSIMTTAGAVTSRVRLDVLDDSTFTCRGADIMVFNTGHWWGHEKTGKYYFQTRKYVYPYLSQVEAYKKGLRTWSRWIDRNVDGDKSQVFFRGLSPTHFRGGQWNSGGRCHNETEPIYQEAFLVGHHPLMLVLEKTLKKMKTSVAYLNVSRLTDYRKDGHPSIYGKRYRNVEDKIASLRSQDCSHWCLPGVPDAWNELFYASLLKIGRGSWGKKAYQ